MFFCPQPNQPYIPTFSWFFVSPLGFQSFYQKDNDHEKNLNHFHGDQTCHDLHPLPIVMYGIKELRKGSPEEQNENEKEKQEDSKVLSQCSRAQIKNKDLKASKDDEEFRPYCNQTKKGRKTPQNSNRNVLPNVMHQVISYIQKKSKSEKVVGELIMKLGKEDFCTVKRFYLYHMLIKDKLNNYVNGDSISILKDIHEPQLNVYSLEEQLAYNKISRILAHYFLACHYDTIILTSKRVNFDKKRDHVSMKRKIIGKLNLIFRS